MVSEQGRKMDALEQSVLVMVRIVSCPSDDGSFMMKSRVIVLKGRVFSTGEIGKSGGWTGLWLIFNIWQVAQPQMYLVTKVLILGHQ
jgi:hypothetical protein